MVVATSGIRQAIDQFFQPRTASGLPPAFARAIAIASLTGVAGILVIRPSRLETTISSFHPKNHVKFSERRDSRCTIGQLKI